ncbi:Hypothetical protein CINCED_3A004375 [Cinara cedri]|uniref:Uncharacterized protein n=1 Tax=Cinara cedri TaxID=506608 RepID=A0A5E4NIB9_9HEMI|nr:Hypothetical protein CINCED_3A004375 [Cinara cedri]
MIEIDGRAGPAERTPRWEDGDKFSIAPARVKTAANPCVDGAPANSTPRYGRRTRSSQSDKRVGGSVRQPVVRIRLTFAFAGGPVPGPAVPCSRRRRFPRRTARPSRFARAATTAARRKPEENRTWQGRGRDPESGSPTWCSRYRRAAAVKTNNRVCVVGT